MKIILFHSFLFLFISYLHGFIFLNNLLRFKRNHNFYETSLIGLLITIVTAQLINFFIPLSDNLLLVNILILILFTIFFLKILKKNLKVNFYIFFLLALLSLANIYGSGFSDDLNHYHYSSIANADQNNFIWGQVFLHPLFGTSSTWLIGHSYFNFDQFRLQDIHVLNGLIFFLILGCFFSELYSSNKKKIYQPILFSLILFILIKYTRLKEFGIDRPSTLIFCFLIYYYLKYFVNSQNKEIVNNFIIILFIAISLFSIKIIYLPVLFFPLILFYKKKSILLKNHLRYLIILLPITVIIIKNLLGTGCIIYPLEASCINQIFWSDNIGVKEFFLSSEIFNKSWHSYTGDLSKESYIHNFNWISTWFERGKIEILELFLTLILIIFGTFLAFNLKLKKIHFQDIYSENLNKILLLIIFLSTLIYFMKNPVIRMYHFSLISLMIFFILLFFETRIRNQKSKLLGILLIIGFSFNLFKNFERILENNFKNDPYAMVSEKIAKQEKKKIGKFTYYIGWYGKTPISLNLDNKNHKKKFIFNIIYK